MSQASCNVASVFLIKFMLWLLLGNVWCYQSLVMSVVDYSCALQKDILVHGRLYISQSFLCFYANIFRWATVVRWLANIYDLLIKLYKCTLYNIYVIMFVFVNVCLCAYIYIWLICMYTTCMYIVHATITALSHLYSNILTFHTIAILQNPFNISAFSSVYDYYLTMPLLL